MDEGLQKSSLSRYCSCNCVDFYPMFYPKNTWKAKRMKKHVKNMVGIFLMVFGIGLFAYPDVATKILDWRTEQYMKEFDQKWKDIQEETSKVKEMDALYREILSYNHKIYETGQKDFKDAWSCVQSLVNLDGLPEGKFGYIKIPAMDVKLPLYLGASENNMKKGAAVLGQTSIPIGGSNTNSVIAGHRGYSGIPYFREIEKLSVGDEVIIKNPWEKLTYRVESISIIEPYDSDAVKIQEGRDMITLITCHPYRFHGKYRYIVYCSRDGKKQEKEIENKIPYFTSEQDIEQEKLFRKICGIILVLVVIFCCFSNRRKK